MALDEMLYAFSAGLALGALGTGMIAAYRHARTPRTTSCSNVTIKPAHLTRVTIAHAMRRPSSIITLHAQNINDRDYQYTIPTHAYLACKAQAHGASDENSYARYVTHHDPHITRIAHELTEELANEDAAHTLLAFVHQHVYEAAHEEGLKKDREYVKYPLETLVERGGDCEDLAVLGVALMKARGLDVALVLFPEHVGIGIAGSFTGDAFEAEGKRYYYAETTGTNWPDEPSPWRIGQLPSEYRGIPTHLAIIR